MSFLNKVVIVTGASSGIGAAIALKFSAEGASVAIVGRNEDRLKNIAEKCEQNGTKPLTIVADVSKDEDGKKIISDTLNHFGKLDVLVNNAGIGLIVSILSPNALQVFDQVIATNLRAVVNLTNLAAPHLIESKGNIINISSVSGVRSFVSTGFAYNASKAGLDHFTKTIAVELATKGVRVNSVNPGPVFTDIAKNAGATEAEAADMFELLKKATALEKISDPDEVAELVLFLASDKARSITGSVYVIDNGAVVK